MTVQAKDFMFNGVLLSSLNSDYELVSFDTSPADTSVGFMDNKVEMSDINYNSPIVHFYHSTAKDTLQFDIMISKRNGKYLTQSEIRELSGWLTSPISPKVLSFVKYKRDDGTAVYEDLEYIGVFNKAEYSEMGQVQKMGVGFSFTNISAFAFTKESEVNVNNTLEDKTIIISSDGTATGLPIYPVIEIMPTEDGTVFITNLSNKNDTGFGVNVKNGEKIVIKDFNVFSDDGSLYSFDNLTSLMFPYLIDGDNEIKIQGRCTCKFIYRFLENIGV